jgi:hypothetical protein
MIHALRHSHIALLDRSGATLKEAMQLARHSDPKLTMAVYGRAQLHDLGPSADCPLFWTVQKPGNVLRPLSVDRQGRAAARALPRIRLGFLRPHHRGRVPPRQCSEVPPLSEHGNVMEIAKKFGGSDKLSEAVNQLQALLYAA